MPNSRSILLLAASLLGTTVSATLLAGPAQVAQAPQTPGFPAKVELVTVDVVALDRKGNPMEGLRVEDFTVTDEGELQTITSFEAVVLAESVATSRPSRSRVSTNLRSNPRPQRTFVIVFDNVHMSPAGARSAKQAVRDFLETGLREGDRVTLVPTSGGAWWTTELPAGYDDLMAVLERLEGIRRVNRSGDYITDWEAMRLYLHRDLAVGANVVRRYYEHRIILESLTGSDLAQRPGLRDIGETHPLVRIKATEVYLNGRDRKRATLAVLERVADSLTSVKGRKSVILVSEGFIHEPTMPEFEAVKRATRRANVGIYFVDARGLGGLPFTADAEISEATDIRDLNSVLDQHFYAAQGAETVAIDSGGFSIKNRNNLSASMKRIADESRSYYLIGYQPTNTKRDGKYRKIKVTVDRTYLEVRARKGYYAPSGERVERDPEALNPETRQGLDSPFSGDSIPLRLTSYVLGQQGEGKAAVLLAADADPRAFEFTELDGRFNSVLDSYMLVSSRDTGENFNEEKLIELSLPPRLRDRVEQSWLPVMRDFELPAGTYQARLLLRDQQSGRIGTIRHEFDVPEPTELRTSTPILTDTLQPGPEGAPTAPHPVPLARRTFASGGRLFYAFQVFGAARNSGSGQPRVSAGFLVWRSDGSTFARVEPQPISPGPDGGLLQMFAFSLAGAEPGEYELLLHVRDDVAGKTLEVSDPFTVSEGGATEASASGGDGSAPQ